MINPMDLSGKHIAVMGAAGGIGSEVARQVARLGGKLSLLDISENSLFPVIEGLEGDGHRAYTVDLLDSEAIEIAIKRVCEESGRLDGAAFCAGINETRPLRSLKPEKLLKVATINYLSYVEFIRCVTSRKSRAEKMSIVGVSSIHSMHGDKGNTAYCSSKAAMDGAMRAMAHELAAEGVRVNNVAPGWVKTAMFERTVETLGLDNIEKEFEMLQYMGEPIEPLDVANAVCFLLSNASKFITGTSMVVAGGYLT